MTAPTTPPPAGGQSAAPPPQKSRYALGSVSNMVRSLVVIAALMVALIFMVPRVNSISQPPVDVTGSAQAIAASAGWPIQQPQQLPDGWKATSVRFVRSTDGVMTWHIGYQSPAGNYVALEQAKDATDNWVRAQVNRAPESGTQSIGDVAWTKYVRQDKTQNSLVDRAAAGGVTSIVTGTGTFAEMQTFIEHLQPVPVPAKAPTQAPTPSM